MSNDDDGEVLTGSRLWSGQAERKHLWRPQPEKTQPEPEDRTYTAFETRERTDCLQLQRATEPSRYPAYSYLIDASFDHHLGSVLTLFYSFGMVVEITGEHLAPVMHAIAYRNCERITEFDPKQHNRPIPGEPLVKRISIQVAKNMT